MPIATRLSTNVYPESEEITLHHYQSLIFQSKARYLALIAGTGGGKTFMGPIWLTEEIRKNPTGDYMLVAPVYKMLESKSLPALLEYFDKIGMVYAHKEQKGVIELGSGGKVFVRSADNPQTLEGPTLFAAWADEAGQMNRKTWRVLRKRVGFHRGRILLTTTPYGRNWLFKEVLQRWKDGNKKYFCVQFRSIDSPYYSKEEYEEMKRELPPEEFARDYDGKFIARSGLVFKEFKEDMILEPFPIPNDWRIVAGIDWGFNHPFVFSLWGMTKEGVYYNFAEYYQRERQSAEHVLEIKKMIGDRHVIIYPDPENPQAMIDLKEEIYRLGCFNFTMKPVKREGKEWVMDGIRYMKAIMWQNKFFVFNNCENIIRELGLYHHGRNADGEKMENPVKKDEDTIDAARYCLYSDRQKTLQLY